MTVGVEVTRAEVCAVACAQAWRGNGEVMASPFGTVPQMLVFCSADHWSAHSPMLDEGVMG